MADIDRRIAAVPKENDGHSAQPLVGQKGAKPHEQMLQRRMALSGGMFGDVIPSSLIKSPWHFIALEDLGVPIPED